jgi:hypothetical protein
MRKVEGVQIGAADSVIEALVRGGALLGSVRARQVPAYSICHVRIGGVIYYTASRSAVRVECAGIVLPPT